jgi:uncharacterized membrane protein
MIRAPRITIQRAILAAIFIGAGVMHFARPEPYAAIVPPMMPNHPLIVLVSGIAELLGGIGILIPQIRRKAGLGLLLLLIAIFPANIYMLALAKGSHEPALWLVLLWLRLPLQPLLIWWVFRATVADRRQYSK